MKHDIINTEIMYWLYHTLPSKDTEVIPYTKDPKYIPDLLKAMHKKFPDINIRISCPSNRYWTAEKEYACCVSAWGHYAFGNAKLKEFHKVLADSIQEGLCLLTLKLCRIEDDKYDELIKGSDNE